MKALISSMAAALLALFALPGPADAQQPRPRPGAQQAPAPAAPQPQPEPQATAPQRTEIITIDNWTVTCRDAAPPQTRKICSALLQVTQQQPNGTRSVVLGWLIGLDREGRLTSVLQTPTGVNIQRGVELTVGLAAPRRLPYVICEPQRCEAATQMDDALVKDLTAAPEAVAVIVGSGGQAIRVTVHLRGLSQVLPMIRS